MVFPIGQKSMICIFSFLARDEGIWQLGIEVGTLMKNHLFHDLFNLPQADCLYRRLTIRNHEDIEVRWDMGHWYKGQGTRE